MQYPNKRLLLSISEGGIIAGPVIVQGTPTVLHDVAGCCITWSKLVTHAVRTSTEVVCSVLRKGERGAST